MTEPVDILLLLLVLRVMFELSFSKFLKEEMKLGIGCRTNTGETCLSIPVRLASCWHGLTAACLCSLWIIVINALLLNLCSSFVNTLFPGKNVTSL